MGWLMVVFLFGLRTSRTNLHHKKPVLFSAQNIVIFVKSLLIFPPFGGTVSVNSVPKARYKVCFFSLSFLSSLISQTDITEVAFFFGSQKLVGALCIKTPIRTTL